MVRAGPEKRFRRSVWRFGFVELLAYTAVVGVLIGPVWSYADWCSTLGQRQLQWHLPVEFWAKSEIGEGGTVAHDSDLYHQKLRDYETWQREERVETDW